MTFAMPSNQPGLEAPEARMDGDDNRLRVPPPIKKALAHDYRRSKLNCSSSHTHQMDQKFFTHSLLQASTTESMSSAPSVDSSDNCPWRVRRDGNFLDSKSYSISKSTSDIANKKPNIDSNVNHCAEENIPFETSINEVSSFCQKLQMSESDKHCGPPNEDGATKKDFGMDEPSVRSYASFVPTQLYPAAAAETLSGSFETASSQLTSTEKKALQVNAIIDVLSDDEENINHGGNADDQENAAYPKFRTRNSQSKGIKPVRCGTLSSYTKDSTRIPFLEIEESIKQNVSRMTLSKSASESDDDTEFKRMETVTNTYQRHDSDMRRKDSTFSAVPLSGIGVDLKSNFNHGNESVPTPKEAANASCSVSFFVKDIFDAISPQKTTPKKKSGKKTAPLSPLDYVVSDSFPIANMTKLFLIVQLSFNLCYNVGKLIQCTQKGMLLCRSNLQSNASPTNTYATSLSNPMLPILVDEKRGAYESPSSESDDGSDSSSVVSIRDVQRSLPTTKNRKSIENFVPIPNLANNLSDGTNTTSSYSYYDFDGANDPVTFYRNNSTSDSSSSVSSRRACKTHHHQEFRQEKKRPIIRYHNINRFQQDEDDSTLASSAAFEQPSSGNRSAHTVAFHHRLGADEYSTIASNSLLSYLGDDENSDLAY